MERSFRSSAQEPWMEPTSRCSRQEGVAKITNTQLSGRWRINGVYSTNTP